MRFLMPMLSPHQGLGGCQPCLPVPPEFRRWPRFHSPGRESCRLSCDNGPLPLHSRLKRLDFRHWVAPRWLASIPGERSCHSKTAGELQQRRSNLGDAIQNRRIDATEISSSAKSIPASSSAIRSSRPFLIGFRRLERRPQAAAPQPWLEKASASQSNRAPPRPASGPGVR